MQCYTDFFNINAIITKKERIIFEKLQSLSKFETAGAMVFDKLGNLLKFNVFLGGNRNNTWGHQHIIVWHTHPTKNDRIYSPPSYIDLSELVRTTISINNKIIPNIGVIFEKRGCWIYRINRNLQKIIKHVFKSKNKINTLQKIYKFIKIHTRKNNIALAKPKKNTSQIDINTYIRLMNNIGFNIKFVPKSKKIILKNIYQCIEKSNSKTKIYSIPPNIELDLLKIKYNSQ